MFHQGDLQSGISLALQQSKSVTCFVTDDSDESKTWEYEWLHDDRIAELLDSKSVNLRLQAGSVEAGFLAAFCPIHKTPALIVVHNGQLRLSLFAGVEKEDFVAQVVAVLENGGAPQVDHNTLGESQSRLLQEEARESITAEPTPTQTTPPPPTQHTEPAPTPTESNTTLASLLPDRAARLEAERRRAAEAEAAARREKAAGKRRAIEEETSQAKQQSSTKLSYASQEKLRKQAQKSELQRILDRLEADKRERREQAEMRRRLREAESGGSPHAPEISEASRTTTTTTSRGPASKSGTVCLRIRLLDGSQLRDYFSPTATLAADVRPRVDAAISDSSPSRIPPYTFKLLLAPQHPNRHLSTSDEAIPLQELEDVPPSATLVLVPVRSTAAAAAYSGAGGGYIGSVYVALIAAYNLVASFVGTFFAPFARGGGAGGGRAGAAGAEHDDDAAAATSSGRDDGTGGLSSRQRSAAAADAVRNRGASNSPAAVAASSSWSAKHLSAGGASHSPNSSGSGSGSNSKNDNNSSSSLDGQADARAAAAAAVASGSSSPGRGSSGVALGGGGGLRIRTLRDRVGEGDDDDRRTEYYNGNSLGFEGDDHQGGGGDGGLGN